MTRERRIESRGGCTDTWRAESSKGQRVAGRGGGRGREVESAARGRLCVGRRRRGVCV